MYTHIRMKRKLFLQNNRELFSYCKYMWVNYTAWIWIWMTKIWGASSYNLIKKRHGSQMLQQMIWLWNDTSHKKVYFNEFVANVLCDNMGMIIFDLRCCGGCYRPKMLYLGAHFGTLTQSLVYPTAPVLIAKDSPRN